MTLKALFQMIDRDNDNELSAPELVAAGRIVGMKVEVEVAKEVINEMVRAISSQRYASVCL